MYWFPLSQGYPLKTPRNSLKILALTHHHSSQHYSILILGECSIYHGSSVPWLSLFSFPVTSSVLQKRTSRASHYNIHLLLCFCATYSFPFYYKWTAPAPIWTNTFSSISCLLKDMARANHFSHLYHQFFPFHWVITFNIQVHCNSTHLEMLIYSPCFYPTLLATLP